jgi:Fe-S oxidoreductase
VKVDIATYKAEFLSHYYARRLRPGSAYAMGLFYWWARLASHAPGVANFFAQQPPFGPVMKRLGGITPHRSLPVFAPKTFRRWFDERGPKDGGGERVLLWPDTFNNHLYPDTAIAAVEVLEALGYRVEIPRRALCCGRPLYDFGMLKLAKRQLRQILDALAPEIEAGVPVVGIEPSCVAVFRDELVNLFPERDDARRLSAQTFAFSEFLSRNGDGERLPRLDRRAVVHGHCHHKALVKMTPDEAVLARLGLDFKVLDSGCCGLAGSFGYERSHYDISMKIGERALLPAVRKAPKDALVIADGFSCRQQVAHATDRRALHLAEVIQLALQGDAAGEYPERR